MRTAPGCTFGHGSAEQTLAEMAALQELYNAKAADKSKSGKAAFSKWRMTHAHAHYNIQPGPHGKPMFHHDFEDQILDPLHLAELGVPKTPWKYGVLNNCSDDAREEIGALLKHFKHPLDTRRKEDNRCRAQKCFTGEA